MKKFYSVLMAMMVVLSAAALTPLKGNSPDQPKAKIHTFENLRAPKAGAVKNAQGAKMNKVRAKADVITEPEGRAEAYSNTSVGFSVSWIGYMMYEKGKYPTEVVWGDNGEVYIRDIISTLPSGIYVKGEYADGKVTVKLPQVCYVEEYDGEVYEYSACVAEFYSEEIDGEIYMGYANVEPEDNYVVYEVGEDGSLTLTLNDGDPDDLDAIPEKIIALVEDTTDGTDDWLGYGDAYQTLTVFDDEPTVLPDGVELEDGWYIICNESGPVSVGFDGDDVYVAGMFPYDPDFVVKGTIDGDKISFDKQYLGMIEDYYIYFFGVEWDSEEFEECEVLDTLVMNYDKEGKCMSVDNPLIDVLLNIGDVDYNPVIYYENPVIKYQTEEDTNAAPEDPYVASYYPCEYQDWLGGEEGYIDWIIPNTNVNGALLNTERMYYNFLLDGEVQTLTTEEYPEFDQDYTDIPYDYTDGWDLQVLDDSHYFSFRRSDITSFGLQSFYEGSDGETYASNVVTYIPQESKVELLDAENKEVKGIDYFDLHGRRVVNPGNGLYIVKLNFVDGTSSVKKVAR